MTEQEIFLVARSKQHESERSAFLDQACGTDATLRRRVDNLLAAASETETILDRVAIENVDIRALFSTLSPDSMLKPTSAQVKLELEPSSNPDSLGLLQHYEILEEIGQGGFGVVFKARDGKLRRQVAIKVLSPQLAHNPHSRRRFLREAQAAAAVRHENVVQVYAVEETPQPFMVMEFVEGETLQKQLDRVGKLNWQTAVSIGRQVASALSAAHQAGLVHRDVKPANILIEGLERPRVHVTDFGLAWAVDDVNVSQEGITAGTPLFMSPEQARGSAPDQRSDLFSLGSVLYAMLTGQHAFAGTSTFAVLKRVVEVQHQPINQLVTDVPEWVTDIVDKLLAKQPEQRFQSAELLIAALDGQEFERATATDTESAHHLAHDRTDSRTRFIVGMAALATLVLSGVIWSTFHPNDNGSQQIKLPDPAEKERLARIAKEAEESKRRELYLTETSGVIRAIDTPDSLDRLQEFLTRWASKSDETDLRGWEWNLIQKMAKPTSKTMPFPESIELIAYSQDGSKLAAASTQHLFVVDADTGRTLKTWPIKSAAHVLKWNQQGTRILIAANSQLSLVDVNTGHADWQRSIAGVNYPAITADDACKVVAFQGQNLSVQVINGETGADIRSLAGIQNSMAFNNDGSKLAALVQSEGPINYHRSVCVYRTSNWSIEQVVPLETENLTVMSWSPKGQLLAIGRGNGEIHLVDLIAKKKVRVLEGNGHRASSLTWSDDGLFLASGHHDGSVRVWESTNWSAVTHYRGVRNGITSLCWQPDGTRLSAGAGEPAIHQWLMAEHRDIRSFYLANSLPNAAYLSCAWHPNGKLVAGSTGQPGTIVWNPSGKVATAINGVQWTWASHGKLAAFAISERFEVHNEAGKLIARTELLGQPKTIAWQPRVLATCDRALESPSASNDKPRLSWHKPGEIDYRPGGNIAWSPSGRFLAFGEISERQWQVRILDTTSQQIETPVPAEPAMIRELAWSPDETQLAVATDDRNVRIYEVKGTSEPVQLVGHGARVFAVAWHPDGSRIATGSADKTIIIWDRKTQRPVLTLDANSAIRHLQWSKDDQDWLRHSKVDEYRFGTQPNSLDFFGLRKTFLPKFMKTEKSIALLHADPRILYNPPVNNLCIVGIFGLFNNKGATWHSIPQTVTFLQHSRDCSEANVLPTASIPCGGNRRSLMCLVSSSLIHASRRPSRPFVTEPRSMSRLTTP